MISKALRVVGEDGVQAAKVEEATVVVVAMEVAATEVAAMEVASEVAMEVAMEVVKEVAMEVVVSLLFHPARAGLRLVVGAREFQVAQDGIREDLVGIRVDPGGTKEDLAGVKVDREAMEAAVMVEATLSRTAMVTL